MKTRKTTTVTKPKPSTLLAALAALTLAGAPLMANETAVVTNTQPVYSGGGYATQARNATQATQARQATGYVSPYSPSNPYNPATAGNVARPYPVNTGTTYTVPTVTTVNPRTTVVNTPVIKREVSQPTSYRLNNTPFTTRNAGLNTRVNTQTEPMETLPATTRTAPAVGTNPLGFPVTNTRAAGLNTRVNPSVNTQSQPVETQPATTHTPATTTTSQTHSTTHTPASTPASTTSRSTASTPATSTPATTQTPAESQPSTTQTQTDTTATHETNTPATQTVQNQPATTGYAAHGSPCPKVNRHELNNRIANADRIHAAGTAQSLIAHSQPRPFYDYNYYNTSTDELANRAAIGNQLAQGMTVTNEYVGGPEAPKTYYRVAGGDFTPIKVSPPIPSYPPTVRPINAHELNDGLLGGEVNSGPGLIKHYMDEAKVTEQRGEVSRAGEAAACGRGPCAGQRREVSSEGQGRQDRGQP